ncbi:AAA family ATPase [Chryseobacterium indoltheticum]|uniref:AAA family ATPase n=1 Tax=Chryseobacterium indoltheticum TaxID=254 RepID=UPI003F49A4D5
MNNYLPKVTNEDKLLALPPRVFDTDIFLRSERTTQNDISIKKVSSGEYQKVATLSSLIYHLKNLDSVESQNEKGSKSVKAFKLKPIYSFKHVNLILDEIELYFHPEFQRLFIKELLERLSKITFKNITSLNILFITHSPFILSDIPKSNVLFLEQGKQVNPMSENTFAANIHSLLQHGFFLNAVPIGDFAKDKINIIFELLHNGKTIDSQGNDLYDQIIIIGEPFIKSQLLKLYNDLKIVDSGFEDKINLLLSEIDKLKKINNDKDTNN